MKMKKITSREFRELTKKLNPIRVEVRNLAVGEGLVLTHEDWKGTGLRTSPHICAQQWVKENGNGKTAKVKVRTLLDGSGFALLRVA